jgi:acyl-CoA synthetase (AMP-forming)/AMP-acid ligase II
MNHLLGAQVVLMEAYEAEAFMQAIERHSITTTALAPTMFTFLLQHPKIDDYDLSSIRSIAYGAAAMPVAVLKEALHRFGRWCTPGSG